MSHICVQGANLSRASRPVGKPDRSSDSRAALVVVVVVVVANEDEQCEVVVKVLWHRQQASFVSKLKLAKCARHIHTRAFYYEATISATAAEQIVSSRLATQTKRAQLLRATS